ncbi:thermosome subunit alpha [Methanimicrococcus blatticola]|uniref:Thermosome subunit n=1 Tax=Methanimicrococcus blatticola TaxID=91560 RepID=A0A484F4T8_9EURY|nr:thermosome subunit alpha [Methanimicrococcus blatticola]MBZ3936137.1 TCP-1/cpn60 chaperonin family protein [Methanimicrococcus blatticola]MCC2508380.1 TCP-1/cpn60 chaperonin family protein [Methanimicrococcus blatticola]TDQ70167.1 thermosome subunit [Methanimicrococcus blatticola]
MSGQPIFILKDGSKRTRGRDAQSNNIMAAKAVAEAVRTTLGPKGMDKMLVDSMGDVTITNDGATILKEMDIEHPAAKMIVEVSKTQDEEVGDGTTSAAVVAGELLKKAEDLIDMDIHPTVIASGYRLAAAKAVELVQGLSKDVDETDVELLTSIASTAITGKGAESAKALLAKISVESVTSVVDVVNGKKQVDREQINVVKKVGGRVEDSELIKGMIIDKERVHSNMPEMVKDAKILLLNEAIELKDTEIDAEISITSPDQLQLFLDQEEAMIKATVDKVINSGATAVFVQKGVDDMAQHFLAKAGLFVVRRVKKSDMEKLARATGAALISNFDEISADDLGYAALVEEKKVSGDAMIFVTGCENPKSVSILLRGGTDHVIDSIETALEDSLRVVGVVIEDKKLVAGGGSPEVELSLRLNEYAATLEGREQLAVRAYAEALEIIPKTLAENAGLDPIDMLMDLRSSHEKGLKTAGLDVFKGEVVDMWKEFVVEPLRVKTQVINAATESAVMILRIDDVIATTKSQGAPGMDMGGMDPGMGMDMP